MHPVVFESALSMENRLYPLFRISKNRWLPIARSFISNNPNESLDSVKSIHLYRQLLRLAVKYPSIKRDKVIDEIKFEFRSATNVDNPDELRKRKADAIRGISHLRKFTSFDENDSEWVIDLEQEPMPKPE